MIKLPVNETRRHGGFYILPLWGWGFCFIIPFILSLTSAVWVVGGGKVHGAEMLPKPSCRVETVRDKPQQVGGGRFCELLVMQHDGDRRWLDTAGRMQGQCQCWLPNPPRTPLPGNSDGGAGNSPRGATLLPADMGWVLLYKSWVLFCTGPGLCTVNALAAPHSLRHSLPGPVLSKGLPTGRLVLHGNTLLVSPLLLSCPLHAGCLQERCSTEPFTAHCPC